MSSEDRIQEPTEVDLLQQIAGGDEWAFGELYDRFAEILFQLAFRILQDAASSEDVLQDTFLQIWEKAGQYRPQLGKPLAWLATLTRNKAIDRLRAAERRNRLAESAGLELQELREGSLGPKCDALSQETAQAVRRAMSRLPAEQRQAIELAFFDGLTQTQIAASLQLPLGTVKARIRRGMLQLRDVLRDFL